MLNKIVSAILTWFVNYLIIPISMVVIDYFRMKKKIKEVQAEVDALKKAQTTKEKDDAVDQMP